MLFTALDYTRGKLLAANVTYGHSMVTVELPHPANMPDRDTLKPALGIVLFTDGEARFSHWESPALLPDDELAVLEEFVVKFAKAR